MQNILVVMSTYNGEKYIKQQLDSILKQEGCNVSLLIRDDGSTDNTTSIIKEYCSNYRNIEYSASSGVNLKPAKSFLQLLREAGSYDYYAFADQDDIWYKDKLITAINKLSAINTYGVYCGNARLVDSSGQYLNRLAHRKGLPTDYKSAITGCGYLGCTMVMNRKLVNLIKNCKCEKEILMHDQYVACVCAVNNGTIIYDMQPHMDYRQHGDNTVGIVTTKKEALKNRIQLLKAGYKVSIAQTAECVLDDVSDLNTKQVKFLKLVANYKNRFSLRLKLAIFQRYRHGSFNGTLTVRLMILLKKR